MVYRPSREDQPRRAAQRPSKPYDIYSKADRWMNKRKSVKSRFAAGMYGVRTGLDDRENPLMFNNRQEYEDIARWLAAAKANEQGQMGAMGPTMQRGSYEPQGYGQYDAGIDDWQELGRGIGRGFDIMGDYASRVRPTDFLMPFNRQIGNIGRMLYRGARGDYDR